MSVTASSSICVILTETEICHDSLGSESCQVSVQLQQ